MFSRLRELCNLIAYDRNSLDKRKLNNKINIFALYATYMSKKAINRLKVVLVEKNLSSKWLAEKLGKNEATISRWCTNDVQPTLKMLLEISELLNVNISELINDNL